MPEKPHNFWQELKRRKVVRVIIGYAAAAYVLLELTSIVAEPLGLPAWTLNFVLVLLCIGFAITIIISWIYDFTSEGIKKTESRKVVRAKAEPVKPVRWKLKVSDIIILVLLVIVVILAYPRVFKNGADTKATASTVTFINDLGEEETREVFDEESVYRVLLFPLLSEKPDTNNLWLGYGIMEGVYYDLSQFPYMVIYTDNDATHHQEQVNSAKNKNCQYYVTGTYDFLEGIYNITYRIHQSANGNIINEISYSGDDLFGIIDSLSIIVRTDIGVVDRLMNYTDIKTGVHITKNADAYRYFIYGRYSQLRKNESLYSNITKAIESDSTFALASYYGASRGLFYQINSALVRNYIAHTMRYRGKFPEYMEMRTRLLNYQINENNEKTIELAERMNLLRPDNIDVLILLIDAYYSDAMFVEAHRYIVRLNELVPDNPEYQVMLADSYLYSNKLNKGLRYIKDRIKEKPGYVDFLLRKVQFHLHRNEWDKAEDELNNAIFHSPENKDKWAPLFDHIEFMKEGQSKYLNLDNFVGYYRSGNSEFYRNIFFLDNHLYAKPKNQSGAYYYPVSDSTFLSMGFAENRITSMHNFSFNEEGEIYFMNSKQSNYPTTLFIAWKQDSLILKAEELLRNDRYQEALEAFQRAYSENPEHYYLANFIKHIHFVLSDEYKDFLTQEDSYLVTYEGGYVTYKKNGKFYTHFPDGSSVLVLPMSEDEVMNPNNYSHITKLARENNTISGLFYIDLQNGEQIFLKTIK